MNVGSDYGALGFLALWLESMARGGGAQPVPGPPGPPGPPAPYVPPDQPQPSPAPVPPPGPLPMPMTPSVVAAIAMNNALFAHGYKRVDQPLYVAFQRAAGLSPADGFPGTNTMHTLAAALGEASIAMAPVKIYPWLSMPGITGYDGVNAPTWPEWTGMAPPVTPVVPVVPVAPVAPQPPLPAPAPVVPPGVLPPAPPWPAPPAPAGLPPFPSSGWIPCVPTPASVQTRAVYWNPILWDYPSKTIRRPYAQEMLGGQWITFAAAWHPDSNGVPHTMMATEAWCLASSPPPLPAPAPVPVPVPPVVPPPAPAPAPVLTPVQAAAVAMNNALAQNGYRKSDQPLYRAFQGLAFPGSAPDGFPGTHTMGALHDVLASASVAMAPVPVYPWHSMPGTSGYDGQNAPTWAQWNQ